MSQENNQYFVRSNGAAGPYFLANVSKLTPSREKTSVNFNIEWERTGNSSVQMKRGVTKLTSILPTNDADALRTSGFFNEGEYQNQKGKYSDQGFRFKDEVRDRLSES